MERKDITIKKVTVNLSKGSVSVDDDVFILETTKKKCILLAYIIAFWTKHNTLGHGVVGFTWKWLNTNYEEVLKICGFKDIPVLRTYWNDTFLSPDSWKLTKKPHDFAGWKQTGKGLLTKIFIARKVSDKERKDLKIEKSPNLIHMPQSAAIEIIPDTEDLHDVIQEKVGDFYGAEKLTEQNDDASMNEGTRVNDGLSMRSDGFYPDAQSAMELIARDMPEAEEAIIIAYNAKMFSDDLRKRPFKWHVRNLNILVRNMDSIDTMQKAVIPRDKAVIERVCAFDPLKQQDFHKFTVNKGVKMFDKVNIRYYHGNPCLRALLVRGLGHEEFSAGFFSIYRQRDPLDGFVDLAAMGSPVLRLSLNTPYEKALLDSVKAWFDLIWNEGSSSK